MDGVVLRRNGLQLAPSRAHFVSSVSNLILLCRFHHEAVHANCAAIATVPAGDTTSSPTTSSDGKTAEATSAQTCTTAGKRW